MAHHLEAAGFSILALNLRVNRLEIDVVARKDNLVVVVEVRSRGPGAWTTGFGSLDGKKRRRIRIAGERLWKRSFQRDPSVDRMRFDAASVRFEAGQPIVDYVPAAF